MTSCCRLIYSSCGCNRNPNSLDWGKNDLICYAAYSAVHVYKYEENCANLFQTLVGHTKLVTSVHWIKGNGNELITTSADKTAAIWTPNENKFFKTEALIGHVDAVQTASGIYLSENEDRNFLIATLSSDSTLKVWERVDGRTVECLQTVSFGDGFGLDVKFAFLHSSSELAMFVSTDDAKISIYTQTNANQFNLVLKLEGHEDWIHSLDVISKDCNLMLASASQDCFVRIWKISSESLNCSSKVDGMLKVDEVTFKTSKGSTYSVSIDTVLSGHENRIYSVRWFLNEDSSILQLLSASMDKTMIVWEKNTNSNIWTEKIRVGEVGGNTLGFYGGVFSTNGKAILAHSHQGALHLWKIEKDVSNWKSGIIFGGHFSPVLDIDWDPEGEYLMSCSSDQTTRIHAPYISSNQMIKWLEVSRPQVHGYEMMCLCVLNRFQFVSSGDEKVLRVFQATKVFVEALRNISGINTSSYALNNVAEGASVPSLGLSNKAVFEMVSEGKNVNVEKDEQFPKSPPTEETLLQNTLWPEVHKLYGHSNEVFTVACSHSGDLVASACKGSKAKHAAIFLWETATWKLLGQLVFHNLTVTQLQFSPNDEFLLSVSRDRMWAVYGHFPNECPPYRLIANLDKNKNVHTRIIWGCAWSWDSLYFATASRDKKVAVWARSNQESEVKFSLCLQPIDLKDSPTALSFAPSQTNNKNYILAVGFENGSIIVSIWNPMSGFCAQHLLEKSFTHFSTVNKLKFSPLKGEAGNRNNSEVVQLASCSDDMHVKIYNIYLADLE